MKIIITTILCLIFFHSALHGQDNKLKINANLGIGTPILNGGICYHIGINPSYQITNYFSGETQVSYVFTDVNSAFLTGADSQSSAFNLLVGLRLYFTSPEKNFRPYFNCMLGGIYVNEMNMFGNPNYFGVGYSTGLFIEYNKITSGITFEGEGNIIVKLGYNF